MEANLNIMEGAQYKVRVRLKSEQGDVLCPGDYRVYGGAYCPGKVRVKCAGERTADEWVLTLPGLTPGRVPWVWQVFAAEKETGVEWLLAGGEIRVVPRCAAGSVAVDPGELGVEAVLDKSTMQVTVQLGESTVAVKALEASASLCAGRAEAAAKVADQKAKEAEARATQAKASETAADTAATNAEASANSAANSASQAQGSASQAKASEAAAATAATNAEASANRAANSESQAQGSASQAKASETAAATAATNAEASANRAANSASQAQGSASQAKASETAAANSASNAETSANSAAKSATEAATSAEQVVESAGTINAHDVYWAAWFKRQTDLANHFCVTKIGSFNYALPMLKIGASAFYDSGLTVWTVALPLLENGNRMFAKCYLEEWTVELPNLQDGSVMFAWAKFPIWTVDLPSLTQGYVMFEEKPMTEFHGNLDKLKIAQGMFTRCSALTVFDSALPALSDAPEMFNMCILTKESALNVLATLPTYTSGTHRITVGIHTDHQGDAEIAEAVAEAEGKGWTVTVQWNGTASAAGASTWGLRGQSVFARVIEREGVDGAMCRVLDWGHYVTDPAGYDEFASVEAAQQALGLTETK